MSGFPSSDEIVDALKSSGYLMEQEVASKLETLGLHVFTNWAFEDPDEGKSREMDVRAIKRVAHNEETGLSAFVELLVECKNSINPFVFIRRKKNETDNLYTPEELVFPISEYQANKALGKNRGLMKKIKPFFHLGFDKKHYDFNRSHKAVQFCRIDRKGKTWTANHGGLYDALFYPLAKAITIRKKDILPRRCQQSRNFWLLVPVVVVSGDICIVDSDQSDPRPEIVNYLTFQREIRSGNINGRFAVDFVRQQYLADFVNNCLQPLISRMSALVNDEAELVLNKEYPWVE